MKESESRLRYYDHRLAGAGRQRQGRGAWASQAKLSHAMPCNSMQLDEHEPEPESTIWHAVLSTDTDT